MLSSTRKRNLSELGHYFVLMQTSDPNPAQNESFDALIDLLTSDDVVEDPRFRYTGQPLENENLRDSEGRMDLNKIHTFFASNNKGGEPNNHSHSSQVNLLDDTVVSECILFG